MLFVLISFVLITQRKPSLQWNIGLTIFRLQMIVVVNSFHLHPIEHQEKTSVSFSEQRILNVIKSHKDFSGF